MKIANDELHSNERLQVVRLLTYQSASMVHLFHKTNEQRTIDIANDSAGWRVRKNRTSGRAWRIFMRKYALFNRLIIVCGMTQKKKK